MEKLTKSRKQILQRYLGDNASERLKRAFHQFWKYCLVGASGFVVNMLIFSMLLKKGNFHYLPAATISFCVAVTNNFLLNKYWTFGNPQGTTVFSQASRFLVISASSLLLNLLVLRLLVEDLDIHNKIVAQAVAISLVTVLNFTGNKMWSFRHPTT